ncbi:TrmH family RNA methyltransferase [Alkalitalea saponilacus]|uniref:SpoU rRNA Methylase family protein n=1 Tax=Alkalitalea saponilacus TaxID=889453 RepID=A0A1T5HSB9_9BACT|nr:TrmH family RNA methyltransferase [Alkalitalea saponilacus]ASB48357.1 methyltransferase [Alkalitalea saponilacus]SKC23586.1 SpoU rRNA Methylase family protein [Alkalitalea saponilacus]
MTGNNANQFFNNTTYPETNPDTGPIIITDRLKSAENIGHIIRLAGNTGCQRVLVIVDDEIPRLSKIKRVAEVAGDVVAWQFCKEEEVLKLIPEDYTIVALETSPSSKNLFSANLPRKMALMVGSERNGISSGLLNLAKTHLHIPVSGPIKSLNVSHAAAICLFHWTAQHIIGE